MDDDLVRRLARFERRFFPRYREAYRRLVVEGQHPRTLFIGCSDSRIVPYVLTGTGPGDLFVVRNVGNLVPPQDSPAAHAIGAAIEFAVLKLAVRDVVVCGHSHCGAIGALYGDAQGPSAMPLLDRWLEHAREAMLPGCATDETLRRTEQRSVVLQLERLMTYPAIARGMAAGGLFLHGWHYLIEEGRVLVLDVESGAFVPTDVAIAATQPAADPSAYQLQ